MPYFMCSHTFEPGAMTDDIMKMFAAAAQAGAPVRGYRSFMNLTEGQIICIVEAAAEEDVTAWFDEMRMPYDSVFKVEMEGERGEIREV